MRRAQWALLVVAVLGTAAVIVWWATPDGPSSSDPIRDGAPSWSPDGSRIAFHSSRSGNGDIYVMNADGSNMKQLTDHPASDGSPSWSPDGERILFDTDRSGNFDVWVMNADGSEPRQLTTGKGRDLAAAWSPDGAKLAYMSDRVGAFQVYIMNADGTDDRRMTMLYTNWFPQWSPDGSKLAFHVKNDVHVLAADASSLTRLTRHPSNGMYPSWSPSGDEIVFMSWRDGPTDLYVMNADGSDQRRVTRSGSGDCIDPRWSPDGSRIVHVRVPNGRDRDGPQNIWVVDPTGGSARQLTGL